MSRSAHWIRLVAGPGLAFVGLILSHAALLRLVRWQDPPGTAISDQQVVPRMDDDRVALETLSTLLRLAALEDDLEDGPLHAEALRRLAELHAEVPLELAKIGAIEVSGCQTPRRWTAEAVLADSGERFVITANGSVRRAHSSRPAR